MALRRPAVWSRGAEICEEALDIAMKPELATTAEAEFILVDPA
jgi:hypothetical protein